MRIENVRSTPIALGDPPLLNAGGLHAPYALRIVVELETERGLVGISEIPGNDRVLEGLRRVGPALRGASVFDQHAIGAVLRSSLTDDADRRGDRPWDGRLLVHAASAIEVACLDVIGRR